jgi:class 3 adenylate cyclase
MTPVEQALLDSITAVFHQLRTGKAPPPISIPDDLPDDELRQLITYVNRFLSEFAPFAEAMEHIARGDLETQALLGRMPVAQSLKALHSNLRHLTWKTQQIAAGDLEQRVDFMGDFSIAFNRMTQQLKDSYQELERRNEFIRKVFGRYTSDEVVEALLDAPDGLKLGGEKRTVTILMSDLRGFTALAERLEATEVVSLLNHYLSAMVEVIQQNGGTIDEIIGDAILVLFGALVATENDARRAVLCALGMQKAMAAVNVHNLQAGWPEIEMGIALHTGEVVVGNIGSVKRSKYGVVGRTINTTARIESFSVGGQVIVSPTLMHAAGRGLILGDEVEVHAKGMKEPLRCRQLLGHQDHSELGLQEETVCAPLVEPVPVRYVRLTGKHFDEQMEPANFVALSHRQAVLEARSPVPAYSNLLLRLEAVTGENEVPELYAKVIRPLNESDNRYLIRFTSVPPGVRARLDQLAGQPVYSSPQPATETQPTDNRPA